MFNDGVRLQKNTEAGFFIVCAMTVRQQVSLKLPRAMQAWHVCVCVCVCVVYDAATQLFAWAARLAPQ